MGVTCRNSTGRPAPKEIDVIASKIQQADALAKSIPCCYTREEKRRRVRAMLALWREVLGG
jgi:hypothetical protein